MKLLLVYNADSGFLSSLKDAAHKTVSPSTYECNLCKITYGPIFMKDEWNAFLESLPYEVEFLHRDEFRQQYFALKDESLPAMFVIENAHVSVAISAARMNAAHSIEDLTALVSQFLQSRPQTTQNETYQRPVCGFHYRNEKTAKECEAWCRKHKSCNIEITARALENEKK